jgi:hypothetical protein
MAFVVAVCKRFVKSDDKISDQVKISAILFHVVFGRECTEVAFTTCNGDALRDMTGRTKRRHNRTCESQHVRIELTIMRAIAIEVGSPDILYCIRIVGLHGQR